MSDQYKQDHGNMSLKYFSEEEFRGFYNYIDTSLLVRLDCLRGVIGTPIAISAAKGSLGRKGTSNSRHNYKTHGSVQAVDVMPMITHNPRAILEAARMCSFGGIGYYPDSLPRPHWHLDVRDNAYPVEWGSIGRGDAKKQVLMDVALRYGEQKS